MTDARAPPFRSATVVLIFANWVCGRRSVVGLTIHIERRRIAGRQLGRRARRGPCRPPIRPGAVARGRPNSSTRARRCRKRRSTRRPDSTPTAWAPEPASTLRARRPGPRTRDARLRGVGARPSRFTPLPSAPTPCTYPWMSRQGWL